MKKIFALAALTLAAAGLKAQVLTLDEAINIALRNSLDIQIARSNVEASQINNNLAVAGGMPVVAATLTDNQSLTNLNQELSTGTKISRNGTTTNSLNSGISGSYLLYNGFRVYATRNRLAALEKQSEQQVSVQIQNIMASVMVKYYDILRQQSYLRTMQQAIDVTLQRKQIVDTRKSVGMANNADIFQAVLDLNASRQEYTTQQLVLNQAKADLMNLLTQRPDSTYDVRDTILVDTAVNYQLVQQNLKNNPELLVADQQVVINDWMVREVAAQRYPSITVNGGFNFIRSQSSAGNVLLNQNYGPALGVGVAIPIFNGGLYRRQQRVAEIDTRNAVSSRNIVQNTLLASAVKSWEAYQSNLQQLRLEQENNKVAADLLQLTLLRYQLAQATIIEVREAQRSFVEAGYRLVNLAYAAKVAEIELKRLAGQLRV